uniref:Uncharacterized protein n=1 Tax=Timema cristinae TaxID=61476 RepID=A0A7R9D0J8_TIMCR|nr:unnamed protein product [Timema cristinae]
MFTGKHVLLSNVHVELHRDSNLDLPVLSSRAKHDKRVSQLRHRGGDEGFSIRITAGPTESAGYGEIDVSNPILSTIYGFRESVNQLFLFVRKDTLFGCEATPRLSPSHPPSLKIGFRLALDRDKGLKPAAFVKYQLLSENTA